MISDDFNPKIMVSNVPRYSPTCHQLNGSSFDAVLQLCAAKSLQIVPVTKTRPSSTIAKSLLPKPAVFYYTPRVRSIFNSD